MSIPAKRSRPIAIDDQKFRWAVASDAKSVVVESGENPGCILVARPDGELIATSTAIDELTRGEAITPKLVAEYIRIALERGWNPNERSGVYHLGDKIDMSDLSMQQFSCTDTTFEQDG